MPLAVFVYCVAAIIAKLWVVDKVSCHDEAVEKRGDVCPPSRKGRGKGGANFKQVLPQMGAMGLRYVSYLLSVAANLLWRMG